MKVTMLPINKKRCHFKSNIGKNEQGNEVLTKQVTHANTQVPRPHVPGVIKSKTEKQKEFISFANR